MATWANWVGNQSFKPREVVAVSSAGEIQQRVADAAAHRTRVRTVGTAHSFTPIVETDLLLDTSAMRGIVDVDAAQQLVRALPKTTIGDFGEPLWEHGLALANQGDIDTQSIAGSVATATHGSGRRFPSFSATLEGAKLVDGTGQLVEVTRQSHPDHLAALQTSIGLLGILTELSIKVAPAYHLHARTDIMPFDQVLETFEHDIDSYRHYGLFWMPTDESARLYNLAGAGADDCVVKRYLEVDPTDTIELEPNERIDRAYRIYPMVYDPNFHEVEYFLPLERWRDILVEMRRLMLRWHPLSIYPLEIRLVAAEDAWMSPNYHRENLVVSISGQPGAAYWPYLRACDSLFAEFGGRPHWGKLHFMTADRLARLFPRYENFLEVRRRFDPNGVFLNDHLQPLFG
ncbi:MAG: FAD-binding protein [Acidimicrobiia bacterium]|nr:FAD-binding protein [Acidimicrobiia bacterium]MDH5505283.1 FAD-binding protein [Acidimicrobiia bacterium]